MNCPVCKINLEFKAPHLEEVYYDCSNCSSSLLFKNGECEVLSGREAKSPSSQDNQIKETDFQSEKTLGEYSSDENADEGLSSDLAIEDHSMELEESAEKVGAEPAIIEAENLPEDSEKAEPSSIEEGKAEDKDFFPDETTQVPELTLPEEEEPLESSETSEPAQVVEEPLSSNPEEDFPFEKKSPENSEQPAEQITPKDNSQQVESKEPVQEVFSKTPDSEEPKEDFAEVAEFGNSQDQDKQGPFLYDLILSEINSQDVRKNVLSVLEDESLNLPAREDDQPIDSHIQDGKIIIEKISPVQAYVIITSLMGLPFNISWQQHHIADS